MKKIIFILILVCIGALYASPIYASTDTGKANLYFYTADGDGIDVLHKCISPKKEYEFKNPDQYKFLSYEDENGNTIYPDIYYEVKGLYWQEVDENDRFIKKYYLGDSAKFDAGDHYFYVKTDNSALTGENSIHFGRKDTVYLHFETAGLFPIDDMETKITKADTYTFLDPNEYVSVPPENGTGRSGKGLYWSGSDENGKTYLFSKGEKAKFKGGDYTFHVVTDEPVRVTYRYPLESMLIEAAEGGIYCQEEYTVGETVRLKKSLGAIIFGSSFKGWEEKGLLSGKLYKGGSSIVISENADLEFYAIYEEDDNWDPDAIDMNTGSAPVNNKDKRIITVDINEINKKGGVGYEAYLDEDGQIARTNGNKQINEKVSISGIPGNIQGGLDRQENIFTSHKAGQDPKDPYSYSKDKYGRDSDDSNISDTINGVLMQDDSAYYMDIYGNSIVYHSENSRLYDMALAYRNLSLAKNESFIMMTSSWGDETRNRYEALEYAFLSGQYPSDEDSYYKQFNENSPEALKAKSKAGITKNSKLPEWKDVYMSKSTFNRVKFYKCLWNGWYDEYEKDDEGNNGIRKVSIAGSMIETIAETVKTAFQPITVYAAETEMTGAGYISRLGGRFNNSIDLKDKKIRTHYYDEKMLQTYNAWYSFSGMDGLTTDQIANMKKIFNALIDHGYSEAMAIGACGNIWQENSFQTCGGNNGTIGIVQWSDGMGCTRKTRFLNYCSNNSIGWNSIDSQIEYLIYELTNYYDKSLNKYLHRYCGGKDVTNITDVGAASEAFCAVFEGCICFNNGVLICKAHGNECGHASDGRCYQHLNSRILKSYKIASALSKITTGGTAGGTFGGMTRTEILSSIFGCVSKEEVVRRYSKTRMKSQFLVTIELCDGRHITCNKYIAEDLKEAIDEIIKSGFPVDNSTYCYRDSGTWSGGISFHNLGLAVDFNCKSGTGGKSWGWDSNPQFPNSNVWKSLIYTLSDQSKKELLDNYQPFKDPYAITTAEYEIMKAHGFLWGRDFGEGSRPDIMHFSLGEVSNDGKRSYISEICESYYRSYRRTVR